MPNRGTSHGSSGALRSKFAAVLGASLLLSLLAEPGPVLATHVDPVLVDGNPVCSGAGGPSGASLGFDNGVKVDPPAGTIDVGPGTVTISDIEQASILRRSPGRPTA